MRAEDLKEEIRWIESVISQLTECLGMPEISDEVRDQRSADRVIASRILKRLKSNSTAFKYRLYSDFVDAYHDWHKKIVGIAPRMTPAHGKAMKDIIAYLMQEANEKTEEGALKAWKFILGKWMRVSPFLQQQKGLLQINKNLTEILDQIRNGHHKTNQGQNRTADLEAELNREG